MRSASSIRISSKANVLRKERTHALREEVVCGGLLDVSLEYVHVLAIGQVLADDLLI